MPYIRVDAFHFHRSQRAAQDAAEVEAKAVAAHAESVAQAEAEVFASATEVVEVSGLERAALILGVATGVLRRQLAAAKQAKRSTS